MSSLIIMLWFWNVKPQILSSFTVVAQSCRLWAPPFCSIHITIGQECKKTSVLRIQCTTLKSHELLLKNSIVVDFPI